MGQGRQWVAAVKERGGGYIATYMGAAFTRRSQRSWSCAAVCHSAIES